MDIDDIKNRVIELYDAEETLTLVLVPFPEAGGIRVNPPSERHMLGQPVPIVTDHGQVLVMVPYVSAPPKPEVRRIV